MPALRVAASRSALPALFGSKLLRNLFKFITSLAKCICQLLEPRNLRWQGEQTCHRQDVLLHMLCSQLRQSKVLPLNRGPPAAPCGLP